MISLNRRHYAWLLMSALIMIVNYLVILKPTLLQIKDLRKQEVNLHADLDALKEKINQSGLHVINDVAEQDAKDKDGQYLFALLRLAQASGLQIEKGIHLNNGNRVQLQMHGLYQQFMRFLLYLQRQNMNLYVEDYSVKNNGEEIMIVIDIISVSSMKNAINIPVDEAIVKGDSPFCQAKNTFVATHFTVRPDKQSAALQPTKIIGRIKTKHASYNLVLLPNGRTQRIKEPAYA